MAATALGLGPISTSPLELAEVGGTTGGTVGRSWWHRRRNVGRSRWHRRRKSEEHAGNGLCHFHRKEGICTMARINWDRVRTEELIKRHGSTYGEDGAGRHGEGDIGRDVPPSRPVRSPGSRTIYVVCRVEDQDPKGDMFNYVSLRWRYESAADAQEDLPRVAEQEGIPLSNICVIQVYLPEGG